MRSFKTTLLTSPRSFKTHQPWHPRAFPIPSSFQERAASPPQCRRWERWISQGRSDPIGRVGRAVMLVSGARSRYDYDYPCDARLGLTVCSVMREYRVRIVCIGMSSVFSRVISLLLFPSWLRRLTRFRGSTSCILSCFITGIKKHDRPLHFRRSGRLSCSKPSMCAWNPCSLYTY